MINQYKVVISNKQIYKEVLLPASETNFSIGTDINCNYRLRKELFFEEFKLDWFYDGDTWTVMCSDNVFISVGDARKLLTLTLEPGSEFIVNYQNSNNKVLDVEFAVAFESKKNRYDRKINIKNQDSLTVGVDNSCNIIINSEYVYDDLVNLSKDGNDLRLNIIRNTYGVYHNGNRIMEAALIHNGDFFSISDFSFYYKDDCLWTEISENCRVSGLTVNDYKQKNNYPKFVRNTRIKKIVDDAEIEILDPPAKPTKPKNNLLLSMLSSMGMLMTAGAMAIVGGGRMIIMSLISAGMAIVTAVVTVIQNKKDYNKEVADRIEKYNSYISRKREEIENIRAEEKSTLNDIYLSKEKKLGLLNEFSGDLFDRTYEDEDFLCLRLGIGDYEANRKINYKKQEKLEIDDSLQELPEKLSQEYNYVHEAPIFCSLKEINALGIVGSENLRYDIFKSIVVDLAIRHFYSDIKMFFIAEEAHADMLRKFRFLPYLNGCMSNSRNIVCDDESKKLVFEYLYNVLSRRCEQESKEKFSEHYIVFFYDLCDITQHPLSRFIDKAKDLGVTFIFFESKKSNIPMGCNKIISIIDSDKAELIDVNDETKYQFNYEKYDDKEIANIVKILAPVKTDEVSLEGTLTKSINLFNLLNIFGIEDLDYNKRWAMTKVYKSMAVPLGVSKTGIVYLDLHDKAHGPHGLVAGTTGSGKSELLQTYILSIATHFHPYEVAFVIIDFKGGGMVNQFRDLPHLLGAITNIDGKEIDRSLKSIKAELQKRQRYFAEAEVNHIDLYIKKYKNGEVAEPLPHLIIIVDEFAELKAEQPEFMKELISAARIGRSLGVHLILATQKPAGQVDDQIWSNSRFKLCLKVQGPEDSNEVLKSPLAAEIKEPGRAYLQVGNNEIFELFQSAYSGASEKDVDNYVKPFNISEVDSVGRRNVVYEQRSNVSGNIGRTQLEAIVESVKDYCKKSHVVCLPDICLPSLSNLIEYSDKESKASATVVDIGIYDDPENQYQGSTFIDIFNKNTIIIGSAQYGKTNLLQLIIREIAEQNTVEKANIYILDFGSMVLKSFEKLQHVGGVVCSSEDEKLKNLFKLLMEEITTRKEKIVSVGVSSFAAYCEAGYTDMPHIYIIVDNMTALNELYLENDDTFLTIVREGIAVGITSIIANSQTSGISYKFLSNFANKVVLYCNDSSEYSNIFDRPQIKPEDTPGRGIVEVDKRVIECQTYLAFRGEKEYERSQEIKKFIDGINKKNGETKARCIPFIPNVLDRNTLMYEFMADAKQYKLPIGLSYSDVRPMYLDYATLGALGICGKEGKGHKNFISNVLYTLNENRNNYPVKVVVFDDVSRKYKSFESLEIVETYSLDTEKVIDVIDDWSKILTDRYDAMMGETKPVDNDLLLMIIQNNDVAKVISEDMDTMLRYKDMVSRYKMLNISIIFTNYNNINISYDAAEPLRMIKQERHLIYFDDLDNLKVFDIAYDHIRNNKKKLQLGDAYYINDDSVIKLKLVKAK